MRRRRTIAGLLAALAAAALGWWLVTATSESAPAPTAAATVAADAATKTDPASGLRWIAPGELPEEGRETLALIVAGGPFPYPRDGVTFQNREGILPDEGRGYYREYTVPTPGSDDRGARRIVAGAGGEQYYSDDHYASFRRIGP